MKTQSFCFVITLVVVISLITSCEKIEDARIMGGEFSLELWSDWKYVPLQGYDTHVGLFTNKKEEIQFDYGYFASVNLDAIQQTHETTYYEEAIIDGAAAKIVEVNKNGISTLILYIHKDESDSGKLWIDEPSDRNSFISVFKSLKFL